MDPSIADEHVILADKDADGPSDEYGTKCAFISSDWITEQENAANSRWQFGLTVLNPSSHFPRGMVRVGKN
jgi:hypothetical protein